MNDQLRKTPLAATHEEMGARMVDFGGWYMPIQYRGVIEEHHAVRQKAGLFDVSHMGEIRITGKDAETFLNYVTVNDVSSLIDGQAQYTVLVNDEGRVLDDLLIYRISADHYLLVVNASTQDKDYSWLERQVGDYRVALLNESDETGQIAIQGPAAEAILQKLVDFNLSEIPYYHFRESKIDDVAVLISRTGYTGEDGFECYLAARQTDALWRRLLEVGEAEGLTPAGLGARDTLRLEARMNLYGNDMDETTTALEAGLGWVVKFKKDMDFIGKAALLKQKEEKLKRKLIGFELEGRGIARHGYPVIEAGEEVGIVTSGTHSPTLKKSIGLGYLPVEMSKPGAEFHIRIRDKLVAARVVKGAFYKRA